MANQSKLKAWVRYDGTGRVISGGPIFQVNKPKVGNWKQINANLCCNGGSTTTTTTTSGGSGGTPTAFVRNYWINGYYACITSTNGPLLFFSSSTSLQTGIRVYSDAALTIPIQEGTAIENPTGINYVIGAGGLVYDLSCSNYYLSSDRTSVCSETAPLLQYGSNSGVGTQVTIIYLDFFISGYPVGTTVYRLINTLNGPATQGFEVQSRFIATLVQGLSLC